MKIHYKNIQRLTATLSDLVKPEGLMAVIKETLEDDLDRWEIITIETVLANAGYYFAIWIGEREG